MRCIALERGGLYGIRCLVNWPQLLTLRKRFPQMRTEQQQQLQYFSVCTASNVLTVC